MPQQWRTKYRVQCTAAMMPGHAYLCGARYAWHISWNKLLLDLTGESMVDFIAWAGETQRASDMPHERGAQPRQALWD